MGILSKIGLAILALIAALVIIGFFLPRELHVEREIVIDAPQSTVFTLVNGYTRFNEWSPWAAKDPDTRYTWDGPSHGVGAHMAWDSDDKNVGSGKQTIRSSTPYEEVAAELDFGDQGVANSFFRLSPAEGGTKVVWGFDTDVGMNPLGRYFGLFISDMLGPDYEQGLANLKALAEGMSDIDFADLDAEVVTVEPMQLAYVTRTTPLEPGAISAGLASGYGEVMGFLGANGGTMAGAPMAIHHNIDDGEYHFDAVMPFTGDVGEIAEDSAVQVKSGYAGKALKVTHVGSYHRLGETYDAAQAYLAAHGWKTDGPSWDAYVDDPTQKPEDEVVTHCYFPLAD